MPSTPNVEGVRPLKRARTTFQEEPPIVTGPVDHIFIADGVSAKKSGVKKTPLSCCECRRLKLKCDRNFPCASCKKRGCAEICPDGVLVSGKGTRFILANTEQLHDKIQVMSERIRVLEEALGTLHGAHQSCPERPYAGVNYQSQGQWPIGLGERVDETSATTHPLLKPELLTIKSTMGLYTGNAASSTQKEEDETRTNPSLSSRRDVVTPPHTERGSSEDTVMVPEPPRQQTTASDSSLSHGTNSTSLPDYAAQVAQLSATFPSPSTAFPGYIPNENGSPMIQTKNGVKNLGLRAYIRNQLPPQEQAEYLWEQAKQHALWQYNPHPSPSFFTTLVHHVYHASLPTLSPRRLSLLLMILAVGCHVDLGDFNRPQRSVAEASSEVENTAEHYHQLARASLCELPIMEETNLDVVLALFWEIWYLLVYSDKKKAMTYAWGLLGLTSKLAQNVGLHRNGGTSKVIPEEVEKRRMLLWELLYLDTRLSLSLGRPPSLSINYVDCQRPSYSPDEGIDLRYSLHHYQEWKHSFYIDCLAPALEVISQPPSETLNYSVILDLDSRIRTFAPPTPLRDDDPDAPRPLVMQRGGLRMAVNAVLLQLHRKYFTEALNGYDEAFNRKHRLAPSVVAVFLSAVRMISCVDELYKKEPELTSRILGFWSNAFSSTVALCLLIFRAPFTCLTPAALQEIERARILFRTAKDTCSRALQVLPMLESLVDKTAELYQKWYHGQEIPTILRHTNDDIAGGPAPHPRTYPDYAPDCFIFAHSSLSQCIIEAHERMRILYPMRKPCRCADHQEKACPPSHDWSPLSTLPVPHQHAAPVLPTEVPLAIPQNVYPSGNNYQTSGYQHSHGGVVYDKPASSEGLYTDRVLPEDAPIPRHLTLSPGSKMAVVDNLNFEFGALNTNSEYYTWMSFSVF